MQNTERRQQLENESKRVTSWQGLMRVAVVAVSGGTRHVFDRDHTTLQFFAALMFKLNG